MWKQPLLTILCFIIIKTLDTTDPIVINSCRGIFVVGVSFVFIAFLVIYLSILNQNDQRHILVKSSELQPNQSPFQPTTPNKKDEMVSITILDYDILKLKAMVKKLMISCLITAVVHYQWKFIPPLLIQSMIAVTSLFDNELFSAHILRHSLTRPFKKQNNPLADFVSDPMEMMRKMVKEVRRELDPAAAAAARNRKNKSQQNKFRMNRKK